MQIKKGTVSYQGRNDWECLYGEVGTGDNQIQYYFMDNGSLPNGNFIASTHLVEAIDREVQTQYIGMIDSEGNVILPFENKSIKVIPGDILLVERTKPETASVLEAIDLKKDPLAATKLVSTPAAIKEKLNAKMGSEGRYLFNDQFSEASIFDFNGNNLINNEYFSFIGISGGKLYLTKNTVDAIVTEYSILPAEVRDENVVMGEQIDVVNVAGNSEEIEQVIAEEVEKKEQEMAADVNVDNNIVNEISDENQFVESEVEQNVITDENQVVESEVEENVITDENQTVESNVEENVITDENQTVESEVEQNVITDENQVVSSVVEENGVIDNINEESSNSVIPLIAIDNSDNVTDEVNEESITEEVETNNSVIPLIKTDENNNIENDEPSVEENNIEFDKGDLDLKDSDVFGESILKADTIDNKDLDEFIDGLSSSDNDNIMDKVVVSMTKLIEANREQQDKIKQYEEAIENLDIKHRDALDKIKSQDQKIELLTNKVKKYEPVVSKVDDLEAKNIELEAKVIEQEKLLNSQNKELKVLRPQAGTKDELLKLLEDAHELLGRDNYSATDNEGNYSNGLAA